MLDRKFIAVNYYMKKEERFQNKILSTLIKKLDK